MLVPFRFPHVVPQVYTFSIPAASFTFLQIEVRYNVPSAKNETCHFALSIEVREEMKEDKEDAISIMARSRERRDNDERERKARKCRKNKKRKSCKTKNKKKKKKENKKNNVKNIHKKPNTEAEIPDALQLKICARSEMTLLFRTLIIYSMYLYGQE